MRNSVGMAALNIAYLADHPEAAPLLAEWFSTEWSDGTPEMSVTALTEYLSAAASRDQLPICLLGLADGDPVATATLKFREIEFSSEADYWLGFVYVREDVRGLGYGRAIVAAAEAVAVAAHFTPLYLHTPLKESLYRRLGWQTVGATTTMHGKHSAVMSKHG
jgi:GNAT superfamily N-acetyltransferase